MTKQLDFIALIIYCGFIYWLSDQSRLPTPDLFDNEDKLHHFLAYFLMGVFAWRAFSRLLLSRRAVFWVSFGFCSLYGLSDEWHQSFVVGRNSSALDWLADSIGGLIAASTFFWRTRKTVSS
jgi:VanZ family protein